MSDPSWFDSVTKTLGGLKDLPLWLFVALAAGTGVTLLVFGNELNRASYIGLASLTIVFGCLAAARGASLGIEWGTKARSSYLAHRRFLYVTPKRTGFWAINQQADGSFTLQIVADALVRNRSDDHFNVTGVRLLSPSVKGEIINAYVILDKSDYEKNFDARITIMIRARPAWTPGSTVSMVFAICDDREREQKVRLEVKGLAPPTPKTEKTIERVVDLTDPIERGMVAVLQSELKHYERRGRQSGGLGSICFKMKEQELRGFSGGWTADTEKVYLASPPTLESDSLLSMVQLVAGPADKTALVAHLLDRLGASKGYLSVSYFIVATLYRLGELPLALRTAKEKLPSGDKLDFGLSNVLMLLNAILRYQQAQLSDDLLDEIERFVHEVDEHPFQIPEGLADIRACRLRQPKPGRPKGNSGSGSLDI